MRERSCASGGECVRGRLSEELWLCLYAPETASRERVQAVLGTRCDASEGVMGLNEGSKARVAGRRAACPVVAQCLERGGPTLFGARDSFESLIKALDHFFERRHMCAKSALHSGGSSSPAA